MECACIATGLLFAMSGGNCGGNGFVPVVPYSSYSEYEEMLEGLIVADEEMVVNVVTPRRVSCWCQYHEGISQGVEAHWFRYGHELFLKFTKGLGYDWCGMMNTMVIHALCTAVRVLIETYRTIGVRSMDGSYEDQELIRGLLRRETRRAIVDRWRSSANNMYLFRRSNFHKIWHSWYSWCGEDELFGFDEIPVAQWQDMQLAFCMINLERLGCCAAGKGLGCDMIRVILAKVLE